MLMCIITYHGVPKVLREYAREILPKSLSDPTDAPLAL